MGWGGRPVYGLLTCQESARADWMRSSSTFLDAPRHRLVPELGIVGWAAKIRAFSLI